MRTSLVIIVAVLALSAFVALGFTAWRLIANLVALRRALARSQARLTPILANLAEGGAAAAEHAARLQARAARIQARGDARGDSGDGRRPSDGGADAARS